jgi:sugar O-acyltransferase (sialic acid O-acetyltransferase NeuD family)
MSARRFIFWGASGHARVLRDLITLQGDKVVALFENDSTVQPPWPGVGIYFGLAGLQAWCAENGGDPVYGAVAVGGARGKERRMLAAYFLTAGVSLPALIHPHASVAPSASVGSGTQVLAGAVIGADAILGSSVIINTCASVDHECSLDDGVHLAPRATLCGCVNIGANTLVGPGAIVIPRIRVGSDSVVGAGAIVTRDLPDGVVAWGSPAKIVRPNTES